MPKNDIEILDTRQSVELGEGVEIHLRIAGPFPRALALLLDMLIIAGIMLVVGFIVSMVSSGSGMVGQWGEHGCAKHRFKARNFDWRH